MTGINTGYQLLRLCPSCAGSSHDDELILRILVDCAVYTATPIWYVIAIDVLRRVATRRRTSNVINSLSEDDSLISLQMDLHS